MNAAEVPDELVENAARALWEADSPAPEIGWPHWDVAVERAANGLWDLPKMVADTRSMARETLAAVLPEWAARTLETEAAEFDRGVNERVTASMVADVRCDVCKLRYEERDEYGCEPQNRAHVYDQEDLDSVGVPLDAPTFYGDQLRHKAAGLRATTPEEPT